MQITTQQYDSNLPKTLASGQLEFSLTLINDCGLVPRLLTEFRFVQERAQAVWPAFKRHPVEFSLRRTKDVIGQVRLSLSRGHVRTALLTALALVSLAILGVRFLDHDPAVVSGEGDLERLLDVAVVDFSQSDFGAGNGRVGFNRGNGEGSRPQLTRARGGGGSGNHDLMPPRVGKIPQPSEFQAPISVPKLNPALPVGGVDIDPALWADLPRNFGDPRSPSKAPSNGPGEGGAIGSGKGPGIGEGLGPGIGPGRNGNMGGGLKQIGGGGNGGEGGPGCGGGYGPGSGCAGSERIYRIDHVSERARVISKPEPQYTEEARKGDITVTVILRVVFSSSGDVTNIRAIQSLPAGLTEKAIAAARQIRFIPAKVDGRPVSTFMQLEYNFNLY